MQKIKFFGIGGQGAVTAAKILSEAVSIYQDAYAITVPAYGHERRGAPVYAHIIIDENPVLLNCYVYEPDIVLVMDDSLMDKNVNIGEGCTPDTILVINSSSAETIQRYKETYGFQKVYACDGTAVAKSALGINIPNSAMLGALARTGLVKLEAMEAAIRCGFGKVGEKNVNAAREAYEHTYEA